MSSNAPLRVGIVGASGFTGAELMRLIASHPNMSLVVATGDSQAGTKVRSLYPSLASDFSEMVYSSYEPSDFVGLDAVFLALPHMASQPVVADLFEEVGCILDLGSDFRLKAPSLYPEWYGAEHTMPELLEKFVYGLPELYRNDLKGARGIAVPGCYPTAASLALSPFVRANKIEKTGVIVDAASGVSGAGRELKPTTTFTAVDENFTAYGLLNHRHTPEIEQVTGCEILFTPHLAPMVRGILATCYARPSDPSFSTEQALEVLAQSYAEEPFIVVNEASPSTKATLGANTVHKTARVDERTGWLLTISALDNLVKGAAGGAIQCANIALGLDEVAGLPTSGLMP